MRSSKRNSLMTGILALILSMVVFSVWLAGCTANEPFDPNTLENAKPIARLFVTSPDEDEELNSTSYFQRTFSWSGSDRDGFIEEFYISVRTDGDNPAPWDTTISTDTTMTFSPDQTTGEASATFLLACRDNRGALSDTVTQFFPMRNHPPVVDFQPDYDPLVNLQRDIVDMGQAVMDTTYWNWGANSFRFFAYDLDGLSTLDEFYRYTLVDGGNPDTTWDIDDPAADPELGWVKVPFEVSSESYEFEIFVTNISAGERTLTVSVQDEANGDPRFQYTWQVRAPKTQVLYVSDTSGPAVLEMYTNLLNDMFGEGNWDKYEFVAGFPDRPYVLLENFRQFEVVIWASGSSASGNLRKATERDGVLQQFILPFEESQVDAGHLLLVSKSVVGSGSTGIPSYFATNVLGISATAAPVVALSNMSGKEAESQGGASYLPNFTGEANYSIGIGMNPDNDTETLFRMEDCHNCYGSPRPPDDPVVAIRRPHRDEDPLAYVICFSLQLEFFNTAEVATVLEQLMTNEMGVVAK